MTIKKMVPVALLLLAILTIGAVSAADDGNVTSNELTVSDDLNLESSVSEDVIAEDSGEGTFADIQKMVNNATWGGTIELSGNYVGSGETINLGSRGLTIHGNGATLDARNLSNIFYVPENGAVLYDINFINAYNSGDGGAIFHQNDWRCSLSMINCTFTNCVSEGTGGAANIADADDCTFINCHANEYAAIGESRYGENHAINCMFINCSSNGNYYAYGMENCIVISNSELYNENRDFKVVQKMIDEANEGDTIVIPKDYYFSCSFSPIIIDKNLIIDGNGSTFDAQKVSQIFYITADNATLKNMNIHNGFMDYDTYVRSNRLATMYGSGVYFTNTGNVINCSFIRCVSTRDGGAIYFYNRGIVDNCTFIDCRASSGGAIYSRNSKAQASNSVFITCYASDSGGGVYNTNCNYCNFTSCSASNYAAVSHASANNCIAENCTGNVYLSSYNSISTIYILQKYDYAHSFEYIQELIDNADEKSTVTLPAGHYYGFSSTIKIEKPVKLRSDGGVTLDGQGLIRILEIQSGDVILENLNFMNL